QDDVAPRGRHGAQEGAGLDAVGHDTVGGAVQAFHALDDDAVGAVAFDVRAHGDQDLGQVDDLGFAGGVFQHGAAFGQGGGHHQVFRAGHGDHVRQDARAAQAFGLGHDEAVLDADARAHGGQALDVLVDRPLADRAAAR